MLTGPLLAMAMPRSHPQAMRHQQASSLPEQEDNDLTLRLPANAPPWQQKLVRLLRKLHMPELVLYWIFAVRYVPGCYLVCQGKTPQIIAFRVVQEVQCMEATSLHYATWNTSSLCQTTVLKARDLAWEKCVLLQA